MRERVGGDHLDGQAGLGRGVAQLGEAGLADVLGRVERVDVVVVEDDAPAPSSASLSEYSRGRGPGARARRTGRCPSSRPSTGRRRTCLQGLACASAKPLLDRVARTPASALLLFTTYLTRYAVGSDIGHDGDMVDSGDEVQASGSDPEARASRPGTTSATSGLTQSSVRSSNLALVLGQVLHQSAPSRADIAAQLGADPLDRLPPDRRPHRGRRRREGRGQQRARPAPRRAAHRPPRGRPRAGPRVNVERLVATVVDLSGELLSVARREVDVTALAPQDAMRQLADLAGEALATVPPGVGSRGPRSPSRDWWTASAGPCCAHRTSPSGRAWTSSTSGPVDDAPVGLRAANDIDCSHQRCCGSNRGRRSST